MEVFSWFPVVVEVEHNSSNKKILVILINLTASLFPLTSVAHTPKSRRHC